MCCMATPVANPESGGGGGECIGRGPWSLGYAKYGIKRWLHKLLVLWHSPNPAAESGTKHGKYFLFNFSHSPVKVVLGFPSVLPPSWSGTYR